MVLDIFGHGSKTVPSRVKNLEKKNTERNPNGSAGKARSYGSSKNSIKKSCKSINQPNHLPGICNC